MNTFNGYAPNESRTRTMRVKAKDAGHSLVSLTTTRVGHRFSFRYQMVCQCGRKFASKQSVDSAGYRFMAHQRDEASAPVAVGRSEHDPCQKGTVGCSVNHPVGHETSCEVW